MATILSIDFDIVTNINIGIWNNDINDIIKVHHAEEEYPFLKYLNHVNYSIYKNLTLLLLRLLELNKEFYFISDHQDIVDIIKKKSFNEYNILFNIDHHHDAGYNIDYERPISKKDIQCGNWVKYLKDNNIIKKYCWVKNNNSQYEHMDKKAYNNYIDKTYDIDESFEQLLSLIDTIDYIVICSSFDWVPTNCRDLFYFWKIICNNNKGE